LPRRRRSGTLLSRQPAIGSRHHAFHSGSATFLPDRAQLCDAANAGEFYLGCDQPKSAGPAWLCRRAALADAEYARGAFDTWRIGLLLWVPVLAQSGVAVGRGARLAPEGWTTEPAMALRADAVAIARRVALESGGDLSIGEDSFRRLSFCLQRHFARPRARSRVRRLFPGAQPAVWDHGI